MTASDTATAPPLRVAVIIGSTRKGRAGGAVGRWFAGRARQRDDIVPDVVDLAAYEFPARYPEEATPQMAAFAAGIGRAEAFVVVTPEYNRSFPASLKQAIDYAYDEWRAKPVGFVSYGYGSAGLYAVEQLRTVFTELHTVTIRNVVAFNLLEQDPQGPEARGSGGDAGDGERFDGGEQAAGAMLDQLVWWGLALRDARAVRPYIS